MIKSSRHNIGCVNNKLLCKTFPDFAIKVLCFLTTINLTFKFQLMVHKKLSWRICKCPVDLWQPGQIVLKKFYPSKNPATLNYDEWMAFCGTWQGTKLLYIPIRKVIFTNYTSRRISISHRAQWVKRKIWRCNLERVCIALTGILHDVWQTL